MDKMEQLFIATDVFNERQKRSVFIRERELTYILLRVICHAALSVDVNFENYHC